MARVETGPFAPLRRLETAIRKSSSAENVAVIGGAIGVAALVAALADQIQLYSQAAGEIARQEGAGMIPPAVPAEKLGRARAGINSFERLEVLPPIRVAAKEGQERVTIEFPDYVRADLPRWYEIDEQTVLREAKLIEERQRLNDADVGWGITRLQRDFGLAYFSILPLLIALPAIIRIKPRSTRTT